MTKPAKPKQSRDPTAPNPGPAGRVVPHGYGKLRGRYRVQPGIDLTKPIFEQVVRGGRALRKAG